MNPGDSAWDASLNDRVEMVTNKLLRWGVFGSLILIMAGTVYCFYSGYYGADSTADLHQLLQPEVSFTFTFARLFHGVRHAHGPAVILLGLLVLIATPFLRVAISVVTFAVKKDWISVAVTLVVFLLLMASFFLGK